MSRHTLEQAALPYRADDSRHNGFTGYRQALSEADLDDLADDAGHGGTLKRSLARLSVWEQDMRRIQAQEAPSGATTQNERETVPRRQRTLSDEAARRRQLLAARMSSEAAANGMNLLQLGAVGPQTRPNYDAIILKFQSWVNQRKDQVVTDTAKPGWRPSL